MQAADAIEIPASPGFVCFYIDCAEAQLVSAFEQTLDHELIVVDEREQQNVVRMNTYE
jgi:hypothetical protein